MKNLIKKLIVAPKKYRAQKQIEKRVHSKDIPKNIKIDLIILNWNRSQLLRNTLLSAIANSTHLNKIVVVDNASTDSSRNWLKFILPKIEKLEVIFLENNLGGEAINYAFSKVEADYVMIAENDLEFLPNWENHLLKKFSLFPNLGFISPFSPSPMEEFGELWTEKNYSLKKNLNHSIYITEQNIGTSGLLRAEILKLGVKFKNIEGHKEIKFPADSQFSNQIRKLGYLIAWSDEYVVLNWGHNKETIDFYEAYYKKNWDFKAKLHIDGISSTEDSNESNSKLIQKLQKLEMENLNLRNKLQNIFIEQKHLKNFEVDFDSCLFFKNSGKFLPEKSIQQKLQIKENVFEIFFENVPKAKMYRWDPLEGKLCKIKIERVVINQSINNVKLNSNGQEFNTNNFDFKNTYDPQIYLKGPIENLKISGTISFHSS